MNQITFCRRTLASSNSGIKIYPICRFIFHWQNSQAVKTCLADYWSSIYFYSLKLWKTSFSKSYKKQTVKKSFSDTYKLGTKSIESLSTINYKTFNDFHFFHLSFGIPAALLKCHSLYISALVLPYQTLCKFLAADLNGVLSHGKGGQVGCGINGKEW